MTHLKTHTHFTLSQYFRSFHMKTLSVFRKTRRLLTHTNRKYLHTLTLPAKEKLSTANRHMLDPTPTSAAGRRKIVVIMGPTGSGKSKLSVDLASRFFPSSEIINADKIQVYRGLDVTTNKIPITQRKNVRHHLLGEFDASESHPEFKAADFRSATSSVISQIISRRGLPFVVGGSNSYLYALLAKKFNAAHDAFCESNAAFCKELRYNCCFLWVDVSLQVLNQYLEKRVDEMLNSGMFEELADYFSNGGSDSGLNKAIGLSEFEGYFRRFNGDDNYGNDEAEKRVAYEVAVRAVKDNTCRLAKKQLGKIRRLRDAAGWEMKRLDATAAFLAAMDGGSGRRAAEIWERQVLEPSVKIVKQFLRE